MDSGKKRRKLASGSYEEISTDAVKATTGGDTNTPDQRRSLFVRSLPASVTTERLTEHFSQSFPLKHATVVLDPQTKISKGFGFVTFADAEDAQAAITQFNNTVLDGRKIKVEVAASRHRDAEDGQKSSLNTTGVQLRAQRQKDQAETQVPRLIVRNLPWSIKTAEDLTMLFRSYGKVKHAVVPTKGPRVQYGFGIVVLRGKKNAEKAIAGVNGKEVDGRTLAVDWAVDKKTWEEQQQAVANAEQLPGATNEGIPDSTTVTSKLESKKGNAEDAISDDDNASEISDEEPFEFNAQNDSLDDSDADGTSEGEEQDDAKNDTTVFIRNLPFTADDDSLQEHFSSFGPIRYARVVFDHETERSKGTAFVCFFNVEDAKSCVRDAPKNEAPETNGNNDKKRKGETLKHSILQNEATDPDGRYTLEGRVLQVSRALTRENAGRRAAEASEKRDVRDRDKRRLYLLSEGSVSKSSTLYEQLGKAEIDVREASARQRQRLIKSSPNLCLSLTRLSIRNIPRGIDSKELKALAREAVVGFAKDVKAGLRQPLSKEEQRRGEDEMREAERKRKLSGKGIVKQAKVVFEDKEGSKVKDGAGRSRGYGFIEYVGHRNALAGLRWLNGHLVKAQTAGAEKGKRLIVEFAIENAQVLQRRNERERRAKVEGGKKVNDGERRGSRRPVTGSKPFTGRSPATGRKPFTGSKPFTGRNPATGTKRKFNDRDHEKPVAAAAAAASKKMEPEEKNNLAKRNRIIAKKRQARKTRKG